MLRPIKSAVTAAFAAVLCAGFIAVPAEAAAKPRVFANCSQLNAVYPHGVGKVGALDRGTSRSFRPVTTFKRENATYLANTGRDGDKDGVACEKR